MSSVFMYAIALVAAASIVYGAVRLFGRRGASEVRAVVLPDDEPRLEILSRTPVGFGRSLVLVQFERRRLLLGVTGGQWTALADLGFAPPSDAQPISTIEAELNRAMNADRFRRGRKGS